MAPSISNGLHRKFPKDVSFSGSGFLSTYQLGVALCIFKYAPWILRSAPCILGSSAGALIAAAVVCEMNLITIRDEILQFAKQVVGFPLGPFHPSTNIFEWLNFVLHKHLPSDAHRVASGRLGVTMTRLTDGKHIIMSDFQSREDVIQALLCSCFVPGLSGFRPPMFKGVRYIDGGLSGIQPRQPDGVGRTLTVCPFSGDADICPADPPSMMEMVMSGATLKLNLINSYRILNGLYPWTLQTIEKAFHSGYKDAMVFLLHNDLVPCVVTYKLSTMSSCEEQTEIHMHSENIQVEEEEKVESENMLISYSGHKSKHINNFTESENKRDSNLYFEMVKNGVLGNMMTYRITNGLPARILSNILLPLMLMLSAIFPHGKRLNLPLREMPDFIWWTWLSVKQCGWFFLSIFIFTIKKNVSERVSDFILLVLWLKA